MDTLNYEPVGNELGRTRGPLSTLTSLRFFAAAAIVVFHLGVLGVTPKTPLLEEGVTFFFVLSGFILAYNYRPPFDVARFYVARIARIWPLHLATTGLFIFMTPVAALWAVHPIGSGIFVANLFLAQSWFPIRAYTLSFNGVSWTLSVELAFYLLFPLLIRAHWTVLVAVIGLVAFAALLVGQVWPTMPKEDYFTPSYISLVQCNPLFHLPEFIIGIMAGRSFRRTSIRYATLLELLAIALALIAPVAVVQIARMLSPSFGTWLLNAGAAPAFLLLIWVFAHQGGALSRLLENRLFVWLGETSFALYLVHQTIIHYATISGVTALWPKLFAVAVICVVTLVLAHALRVLVETPARRLVLRLYDSRAGRPEAAVVGPAARP